MTHLSFLQHILSFQLPPAAAGAHVTALYRLTEDSGAAGAAGKGPGGPRASGVGSPEAWSKQVYAAVQDSLRRCGDASGLQGLHYVQLLCMPMCRKQRSCYCTVATNSMSS